MDHCLRVWDIRNGTMHQCMSNIHTSAVTSLSLFRASNNTSCILSGSLDRTIKVWNATTGEGLMDETVGDGVTCMAIAKDTSGVEFLLVGTESGSIQCRLLEPQNNHPALKLIFATTSATGVTHNGAVRSLAAGPSGTFYSGGVDGNLKVFAFAGNLLQSLR